MGRVLKRVLLLLLFTDNVMLENCGSCFAAEQFVDIKLGAKCLLTLTSEHIVKKEVCERNNIGFRHASFDFINLVN